MQAAVHGHFLGISLGLWVWVGIIAIVSIVLSLTTFGRRTYAIGNNSVASYLAGINVVMTTILLYMLSGAFAALAGICSSDSADRPARHGDPLSLRVDRGGGGGGVSILGGRGHYLGTAAGAVSLVALISVLQAVNMPEYGRNILYGVVVIALILAYGREEETT